MIVSLLLLGLLTAPLMSVSIVKPQNNNTSIITQNNTPKPRQISTTQTAMTLPFEMKAFIDDSNAYFNASKITQFIDLLESKYGLTVVTGSEYGVTSYNYSYLSQYSIFVLPESELHPGVSEQKDVVKYINTTRSLSMILGEMLRYASYLEVLSNISKPFGVEFLKGNASDPTNYSYYSSYLDYHYPIAYNWANNTYAVSLSNNRDLTIYMSSTTSLNISNKGLNGTWVNIYPLVVGDSDTMFNKTTWGSKVIYMVLIETKKGMALFSGSTGMLRDSYGYFDHNEPFIDNLIRAYMSQDLEIVSFEAPSGTITSGNTVIVNITVRNNAESSINDVYVGLEIYGAINLLNNVTHYINLGTLNSGEQKTVRFVIEIAGTSNAYLEAKVWSMTDGEINTNIVGDQRRVEFTTLGLLVGGEVEPDYIVLPNFNRSRLTINITNPAENPNATNVNVSIQLPDGVQTINDTFYELGNITNGSSRILVIYLITTTTGVKILNISVSSGNLGTAFRQVRFRVYGTPFIVYDQGHEQYFTAGRLSEFISLLEQYGDVYINNGTLDANLIGNASLIVLPIPGVNTSGDVSTWYVPKPLTSDEVNALVDYINNGGKLIAIATWYRYILDGTLHGLNNVTSVFGIYFQDAEIIDEVDNDGKAWYPILRNLEAHPIASDVEYVIAASSTYMLITGDAKAIVRGNPTTYGATNESNAYYYHPTGVNGSNVIAVAAVETQSHGRIVAFGGGSMLSTYFDNNSLLIENSIIWILGDTEAPTIAINVENITDDEGNVIGARITVVAEDNLALKSIVITVNATEKYRNEELLTHRYTYVFSIEENGTYVIQVVVEDHAGLTTSAGEIVFISVAPPPTTTTTTTTTTTPMPQWIYFAIAGVVIVIGIGVAIYIIRRRSV